MQIGFTVYAMLCTGNCMSATIAGPYTYSVTAPSFPGNTMSVTCNAGYAWNSVTSVGGSRTATCTYSAGVYSWVISGGTDQCLRTYGNAICCTLCLIITLFVRCFYLKTC